MGKVGVLISLIFSSLPVVALASSQWSSHQVVTSSGTLHYQVYIPNGRTEYRGAILGLHGCHQTALDFANLARLPELADHEGLILVIPEQSISINSDRCWNWFLPINQSRVGGEPEQFIKALKEQIQTLNVMENHIYALGISAGGIMANVMGSCYPEIFSGVGIHSGMQYAEPLKFPDVMDGSMRCPIVSSWFAGNLAFSCSGRIPRKLPNVILLHGDADRRIYPCNQDAIFSQWIQMADLSDDLILNGSVSAKRASRVDYEPRGEAYPYSITDLATPDWRERKVVVHGLAHAWSGGPVDLPYSDPLGPNATQLIWDFFKGN